jgi:hypothetical protein
MCLEQVAWPWRFGPAVNELGTSSRRECTKHLDRVTHIVHCLIDGRVWSNLVIGSFNDAQNHGGKNGTWFVDWGNQQAIPSGFTLACESCRMMTLDAPTEAR